MIDSVFGKVGDVDDGKKRALELSGESLRDLFLSAAGEGKNHSPVTALEITVSLCAAAFFQKLGPGGTELAKIRIAWDLDFVF